ncbi:DoxX family protein [Frondihabitans cladoniiphilus]|uniref:Oxidoreductase n=1 Tax=Frondihabitans cladoniiphilus TaxID=715785 RepID=A0ABP8W946_9MICO
MSLGTFLLRAVVGGGFVAHGLQKLNGSFDGPGLKGVEQMMTSLDMHPAPLNARLAALTETAGGAAIVLGAGTPLAAAGLVATMVTAIRKVHWNNGFFNSGGGFEYNATLIAALGTIAAGPGIVSFDAMFGKKKWGVGGTLFALAVGAASSVLVIEAGKRNAPAAVAEEPAA